MDAREKECDDCCCDAAESELMHERGLWLSYFTICYNIIEGIIALIFGAAAGSIALISFGLDSFVESSSGGIMIWRFRQHGKVSKKEEERLEYRATRLVGVTLFLLAGYIAFESISKLYHQEAPDPSFPGIVLAIVSIIVMPVLYFYKARTSKKIGSRSLRADSKQTLACFLMSIALLAGLGMNYQFGFWQADPIAGLLIVGFLLKEGYEALVENELCAC